MLSGSSRTSPTCLEEAGLEDRVLSTWWFKVTKGWEVLLPGSLVQLAVWNMMRAGWRDCAQLWKTQGSGSFPEMVGSWLWKETSVVSNAVDSFPSLSPSVCFKIGWLVSWCSPLQQFVSGFPWFTALRTCYYKRNLGNLSSIWEVSWYVWLRVSILPFKVPEIFSGTSPNLSSLTRFLNGSAPSSHCLLRSSRFAVVLVCVYIQASIFISQNYWVWGFWYISQTLLYA